MRYMVARACNQEFDGAYDSYAIEAIGRSHDEIRQDFFGAFRATKDNWIRMAVVLVYAVNHGIDVSEIRAVTGDLFDCLLRLGNGKGSLDLFVQVQDLAVAKELMSLPADAQKTIAMEGVTVYETTADGGVEAIHKAASDLTRNDVAQAVAPKGRLRPEVERKRYAERKASGRPAPPLIEDRQESVRSDNGQVRIVISGNVHLLSLEDAAALASGLVGALLDTPKAAYLKKKIKSQFFIHSQRQKAAR